MMEMVKLEHSLAGGKEAQSSKPDNDDAESSVTKPSARGRKRRHKTQEAPSGSRRSTRPRTAPKQYNEEDLSSSLHHRSKTGRAQWKEEELGRLLDCLKKYQRSDNVRSVKKHVKTKNLEQVEAKIEYLRKKALERALDETVSMPPLQCWETLAKDVTSTLSDDSYKEISKVFWTATSEPSTSSTAKSDPNQPNYNEIYKYLAALLRGTQPAELSPIDAMVVLECLNNTVEFLQNLEMKDQTSFLQKRYEDLFFKLYAPTGTKSNASKASAAHGSGASEHSKPDHSHGRDTDKPSTAEAEETNEPIGLGTLNPLNIPVNKLNLLRPPPCSQHGNLYCWIPACRERHKSQQT